jgi:hypothetical protein
VRNSSLRPSSTFDLYLHILADGIEGARQVSTVVNSDSALGDDAAAAGRNLKASADSVAPKADE